VKESCVDAESVVPEPDPIVPKEADITHDIPETSAVLVVAVTTIEDPIAKGGCENVTDVGKEYIAPISTVDTAVVRVDAKVNVKVCCDAEAVTVAFSTLLVPKVEDSVTVAVLTTEIVLELDPVDKVPRELFKVLFV